MGPPYSTLPISWDHLLVRQCGLFSSTSGPASSRIPLCFLFLSTWGGSVPPWLLLLYVHPFLVASDREGRLRLKTARSKHTWLWQAGPRTAPGHIAPNLEGQSLGEVTQRAVHGPNTMLGKTCINKATISPSLIIYLIYCVPGKYCMKKSICWLLYSH